MVHWDKRCRIFYYLKKNIGAWYAYNADVIHSCCKIQQSEVMTLISALTKGSRQDPNQITVHLNLFVLFDNLESRAKTPILHQYACLQITKWTKTISHTFIKQRWRAHWYESRVLFLVSYTQVKWHCASNSTSSSISGSPDAALWGSWSDLPSIVQLEFRSSERTGRCACIYKWHEWTYVDCVLQPDQFIIAWSKEQLLLRSFMRLK